MLAMTLLVLGQLPPGVEAKTVWVNRSLPCPSLTSQSALCDEPSVVEPSLGTPTEPDRVIFIGKSPGRTTCSCGMTRGFRHVVEITVISIEEGVAPVVRKVVGRALARLYTANGSTAQVP